MAKITDTIELVDGVSDVLRRIGDRAEDTANRMLGTAGATRAAANSMETLGSRISGVKSFILGNVLANAATNVASMVSSGMSGIVSMADEIAGINARLKLIAGSQENVVYLNGAIMDSANRARGAYMDMAQTVAGLSVNARDAFPDPRETVGFVEGLQKLFIIGGASAENQKFALLQLQQALASGRLQGDEFRSITENAPILQDMIARTMGVSRGELKQLAAEGAITADIIKNAVMGNAEEIEERFAQMPRKWSDHLTSMKNAATAAFMPIMAEISSMANSQAVKDAVAGIGNAFRQIAPIALAAARTVMGAMTAIAGGINRAYSFVSRHMTAFRTVAILAGVALGIMASKAIFSAGTMAVAAGATIAHAVASAMDTAALLAMEYATGGLTGAMMALNATLYASPLFWIPAVIVLIVGALYLGVTAFNHFAGASVSATGVVVAVFYGAFAFIRNLFFYFENMAIAAANFFGSVWNNPLAAIQNLFAEIWNGIVGLVESAVNGIIDLVNKIPGMDKVGKWDHVQWGGLEVQAIEGRFMNQIDYTDIGGAAGQGYQVGANIFNFDMPDLGGEKYKPNGAIADALNDIGTNTGNGAAEGKRAADALDTSEDDLRYLREIAERESINRYTTASVTIEMGGVTNKVENGVDLDGVVDRLTEGLYDGMSMAAREVHV